MTELTQWQVSLPEAWKAMNLKYVASYSVSNVDKLSNDGETPVELCNYTDVYKNDYITSDLEFMKATATEDEINKFGLEIGDVLITKDSESWDDIGIPALVVETKTDLLCGYHLAIIKPDKFLLNPRYLFRCLQAKEIRVQLELASTGVTRYGLPKDAIGSLLLPLPDLVTQERLVDNLDKETSRIDAMILAKEKLIKLLEEKKQAFIAHVVTKGLEPKAKMKDSGIEWFGLIPENWNVVQLRYVCNTIKTGGTPLSINIDYKGLDGIEWFTPSDFNNSILLSNSKRKISPDAVNIEGYTLFPKGSVFIIGIGATLGKVGVIEKDSYCNQQINALILKREISNLYLGYLLRCCEDVMKILANSATLPILNQQKMGAIPVLLPSVSEQKDIVDIIGKKVAEFDRLSICLDRTINLLKEKRNALISFTVFGKNTKSHEN